MGIFLPKNRLKFISGPMFEKQPGARKNFYEFVEQITMDGVSAMEGRFQSLARGQSPVSQNVRTRIPKVGMNSEYGLTIRR
jgi:hypothetical protein